MHARYTFYLTVNRLAIPLSFESSWIWLFLFASMFSILVEVLVKLWTEWNKKNLGGVEKMEKLLGGDVGESIWVLLNPKVGEIKLLRALMLFRTAKLPRIAYGVEFKWLLIVWSDGRNHGQGSRQKKKSLKQPLAPIRNKTRHQIFFCATE